MDLKEKILNADDIKKELLKIDEWGVTVEVRSMSAKERSALLEKTIDPKGKVNFQLLYPAVAIACSFDPKSGERIFAEADADALNEKSASALERIVKVGLTLSGLDVDSIEVAQKN